MGHINQWIRLYIGILTFETVTKRVYIVHARRYAATAAAVRQPGGQILALPASVFVPKKEQHRRPCWFRMSHSTDTS